AMRILILDDDPVRTRTLAGAAARGCPGADVHTGPAGEQALAALDGSALVILGPTTAPDAEGLAVLRAARARAPALPLLMVGTQDGAGPAVAAMKAGASDYVVLIGDGGEVAVAVGRLTTAEA